MSDGRPARVASSLILCLKTESMVKLDEVTSETYFPRGGASEKSRVSKESKGFPDKKGQKRKADDSSAKEIKKAKEESSWNCKVSEEGFIEGLTGVGVVAEVYDDGFIVHTCSSQNVRIDVSEVSKKFSEMFNSGKIDIKKAFKIGQMVPFKVLKKKELKTKGSVQATCNPSKLNKHLSPNMLVAGLVLHTSVQSIEEKGAILDIGLDQVSGFIEKSQQPSTGLIEGQPLIVRILKSSTSRVVQVTSFVEQDNLNMATCEKLQLNQLMPGTIVECEPTGDEPVESGVFVTIGNGLRGLLPRRMLPPRLREKPENLTKTLRAVVMFCQQNNKTLVLNAHPDIVAISKIEKRVNFEGISIGDKIRCKVVDSIVPKNIVYFGLPDTDGKKSLVTAVCSKGFLDKPDKIVDEYPLGEEKLCRVIGYKYAERAITVSTRPDIIKQKVTSYKDAICGEIVEGKVVHVSPSGVHFSICSFVRAFAPLNMLSDKAVTLGQKKGKFQLGSTVKCRIWEINEDRKQIIVSCREKIVALKSGTGNHAEDMKIGQTYPCIVKKIFSSGVILLRTYNNIFGVLKRDDAKKLSNLKLYDYVEANVEKLEEGNRIVFVLSDSVQQTKVEGPVSDKKLIQKPKIVDKNILDIGHIYKGLIEAENDKVISSFTGKDDKEVNAVVEDSLLSDLLDAPIGLIKRILNEKKEEVERIVPLGRVAAINRVTIKRSIAKWVKENSTVQKSDDLKEGKIVCGVVTQILSDTGVFVEIVGGSGLVGKVLERRSGKMASELFEIGQVVIAKIVHLDSKKATFLLDAVVQFENAENVLENHAVPILQNIIDEVKWLAEKTKIPAPGSIVNAKISKELDDLTLVEFENAGKKISGIVHKNKNSQANEKNNKKEKFVVIDVNHSTNEVILAQKSKNPIIASVRRDYLCAIDSEGLIYLPTRLHPNHLPALQSNVKINDPVDVSNIQKYGNVRIAIRSGGDIDDETRVSRIVNEFVGDDKSVIKTGNESVRDKTIKNFSTYTGVVTGEWLYTPGQTIGLYAKVSLPAGNIGRIHVSELPHNLMVDKEKPLESFLKRNLNKSLVFKVIGLFKSGNEKVAELTLVKSKINAGKVRASELAYQANYEIGELVRCFGAASLTNEIESDVKVEVSGLWKGTIPRENLSDDLKIESEGEIIDLAIKKGELRNARVVGVDKKKKILTLSLVTSAKEQEFLIGSKVTGRVFSVEGGTVLLKLSSGQQAILPPTGITNKYESVEEIVRERFSTGKLVDVVCVNVTESPKRYFVVLPERFEDVGNSSSGLRNLLVDSDGIEKGDKYDGIVRSSAKSGLYIELGPGVSGKIPVTEENQEVLEIGQNSVVRVGVEEVGKTGFPTLTLEEILIRKWAVNADRKRQAELKAESKIPAKVALIEESVEKETVNEEDPGFDWSNKGFRNEDLAAVGKLTKETKEKAKEQEEEEDDEEEDEEEEENDDESGDDEEEEEEDEKIEESEEDISKQLRSDPNSAILWIKYMSLFLEKSDLAAARATAERAIETINYRESAELRNMWTAYLNMEVAYGDQSTVKKVFERACNNADSYTIHNQLAQIYQNSNKNQEARQILDTMIKKFRAQHIEVWTLLAEHLMKQKDSKAARDLLQRALSSVQKQQHTQLISKFAQLEFNFGDSERGTTLFEGLVTAHPKKNDLWLVYVDAAVKHLGIEQARKVLERACAQDSSLHKMRPLYKKWLEIENKYGDAASVELVKSKAEKYLQSVSDSILSNP